MGKFFQKNIAFNCCPNALRNGTLWRDHSAVKHYDPWDEQNSGDKHFDFPQSLIPQRPFPATKRNSGVSRSQFSGRGSSWESTRQVEGGNHHEKGVERKMGEEETETDRGKTDNRSLWLPAGFDSRRGWTKKQRKQQPRSFLGLTQQLSNQSDTNALKTQKYLMEVEVVGWRGG